jgi:Flp pilus assembly protein TadG
MRTLERSDSRGTVATGTVVFETALVTPLLVLIVLGIIEMALLMRDNVAVSSLVRDGGHAATATLETSDGGSAEIGDLAAAAIARAKSTLSKDEIAEVWVYEANASGFPLAGRAGTHFDSCEVGCVSYTWDADTDAFRVTGGSLPVDALRTCGTNLGVYVKARHSFLTGVFRGVSISKHETFKLATPPECQVASS